MRHHTSFRILVTLACMLLGSCGGGGSGGGGGGPIAPTNLSYPTPVTAVVGSALAALNPTVAGVVTTYSVSPALPAGLQLDSNTGVISGTPSSIVGARSYVISAANSAGATTFSLSLATIALTANAGSAQTTKLNSFVTLDASASSSSTGDPLRYAWTLTTVPSGSEAALAATSSVRPVFRADKIGSYIATLVVSDAGASSRSASVQIVVEPRTARIMAAPATNSVPVNGCQEIVTPGNYVLRSDLLSTARSTPCISIHDTNDVVLHCDGHRISDSADQAVRALEIRNVSRFTIIGCQVTTNLWRISDSPDGRLTDNVVNAIPGVAGQPVIFAIRSPRMLAEFNTFSDVMLQTLFCSDAVFADNRFAVTPGHRAVIAFHVGASYASNVQVLRNEFDGGWNGTTLASALTNEVDDAIVTKDVSNVLIRHNSMQRYFDLGFEWSGKLDNSLIEANVIAVAGYGAIGGWYWSSVSNTRFVQNLADQSRDLFHIFRDYGLRPADFDGPQPADTGVYFRNNLFDGNVQRSQRSTSYDGVAASESSLIPVFERMRFAGRLSGIPGERQPADSEFDLSNNTFVRNDFGKRTAGPQFGPVTTAPPAGVVIDGGQNICLPTTGAFFPLACQ